MATFDRNLYIFKLIFFIPNREAEKDEGNQYQAIQNGRRKTVTNPKNYSRPKDMKPPSPHRLPKPKKSWLRSNQESAKKRPQEDSRKQ